MKLRPLIAIGLSIVAILMGCSQQEKTDSQITVLLRMMPAQERFLRENILPEFEKQYKCKVNLASFEKQWDIKRLLDLEKSKANPQIAVVKTPFEMTRVLARSGAMMEMTEVGDSAQVIQDLAEYHPLGSGLGYVDDQLYYFPRKLETRILFYRKSKVADAIEKFENHRDRINEELKADNGYGLPVGYELESNPGEWDFYDLYTVGSIWANEEYNGVKVGRIAHRGAQYGGTALFLVDRALQLGATKDELLDISSDKVAEMFLWENIFVRNKLYNFSMWQDKWKGSDIYNGIKDGKVYLSYLQQIDCFNVHGWKEDPGMPGYLPDASDMGVAVVPKAVSFGLDNTGKPLYEGSRSISTGGWWWGVPETCPNKEMAYNFIRFMTSKEVQAQESTRFGMIPVRKDLLMNLPEVFERGWVGEIFGTSVEQIRANNLTTVPLVRQYADVSQLYVDAWYRLCVDYDAEKDGAIEYSSMKMKLAGEFSKRLENIMAAVDVAQ